jgi:membrane protein DedA with SNARE-associated domain
VGLLSLGLVRPPDWLLDQGAVEHVLEQLAGIAPHWVYLALAVGVVIESFFPTLPADKFVALGAFLTAQGQVTRAGVFLVTWSMNTGGALLEKIAALYNAHGSKIIFASRFLPAFRSLVPVFAGVTHLKFWRTAVPIAAASAIWYGVLVYLGAAFGRNWQTILDALNNVNATLLAIAGALGVILAVLWWKTRHHSAESVPGDGGER